VSAQSLRVGIVGWGAIAREVAAIIANRDAGELDIVAVLHRAGSEGADVGVTSLDELLERRPHIVVEAASQEALQQFGPAILRHGVSLICASVGALAVDDVREALTAAGRAGSAKVIIPSGAVGALDLLRAARVGGLTSVEVEQRKPPAVLLDAEEAAGLTSEKVVFQGSARDAARRFPRTMNIVAAVALAGLGLDDTVATVVADPGVTAAQVQVTARGAFGSFSLGIEHRSSENPATSIITPWSIVATLENELTTTLVYR
jgi:aspartate dehydrogenase